MTELKGKFIRVSGRWFKILAQAEPYPSSSLGSVQIRPVKGRRALWVRLTRFTEIRDASGAEVAR